MNILVICHEFPPVGGGAANASMHISRELAKKNHAVTVLTSSVRQLPGREKTNGFEIIRTPSLRRRVYGMSPFELLVFTLSAIPTAMKLHRQRHFDWCLAVHGIPAAWVSLVLCKLHHLPYLVSLQGADVPGFLPERYDQLHNIVIGLTRLSWRNAKRVVANSQSLKLLAERTGQTAGVQVDLIPNGVDFDFYRPAAQNRGAGPLKALFVGRITEQKGLIHLFQALKENAMELRDELRVEIVGDGNLKDDLLGYVEREGLSHRVSFSPWLGREEVRKKYQSSTFLVLPSLDEGMSNVILEAMACGLPVLATTVSGNTELVQEEVNGFLFPPGDSAALSRLLVRMTRMDRSRLTAMGRASRERAERYSWSKVTQAYLAHLGAES